MTAPKSTFNALEKVFAAEINGRLPFQSKAKIYRALESEGWIAPMERTFGNDAFKVKVSGWQLTNAGRFMYCSNCSDGQPAPPPPESRSGDDTKDGTTKEER